jgi:hypothetical protein
VDVMMADLFSIPRSCDEVAAGLTQTLAQNGLGVTRSFDLHSARAAHTNCACPHHGTALCDCQLVILLVYEQGNGPVTLLVHGRDGQTSLSLADNGSITPEGEQLEATILKALAVLK